MKNFVFYNPGKVVFGKGKIATIGAELKAAGKRKILFVAGGGSIKKNGVYHQVINSLIENGIEWIEDWDVQPNPCVKKVRQSIKYAKMEDVQAILAVGGGSVIDSSKAVAAGINYLMIYPVLLNTSATGHK
jgi:alcohol dehydrogenase YqhD (iron-dependent ADH family)